MADSTTREKSDPLAALTDLDGVPAAVESARTAVDRLRAHRIMRRQSEVVTAESLRRGAVAAAALETGLRLSPTTDQELLSSQQPSGRAAVAVLGAGRAYNELGLLGAAWARSPAQVLARLHLLAAREVVGPELLGRPRGAPGQVALGPYDALLGAVADPSVVAHRLDALTRVLAATRAPALVVAAVVHAEIATLRPFAWGNTVVALAAQRLVLVDRGLDPRSQAVVEVGHLSAGAAYGSALAAYATGDPLGVGRWIVHCGTAVVSGAQEGLAICESLSR